MENKKEQKQAKKADEKKLSEEELKNTKGGGISYNMTSFGEFSNISTTSSGG